MSRTIAVTVRSALLRGIMDNEITRDPEAEESISADWRTLFDQVEEPYVSQDGQTIAAVVQRDDERFSVCANGKEWQSSFEKIWYLRFTPDGRATALVMDDDEWTLAVDGKPWEKSFEYAWNTLFSANGKSIAIAAQDDSRYFMVLDGKPWEKRYHQISDMILSEDGTQTAAVVQTKPLGQGEIAEFQEGVITVAVNGECWPRTFMGAWRPVFSAGGSRVAASVRLNQLEYTIAVNGECWGSAYKCVWEPAFRPGSDAVLAPVMKDGKWRLFAEDEDLWRREFFQLFCPTCSDDGARVAAIVAPSYGKWTIAVDGSSWRLLFDEMVTDLVLSPGGGDRVAAVGKHGGRYSIVVDGVAWPSSFDMVWKPVFSPCTGHVAAKVGQDGRYGIALDGKLVVADCDATFSPVFDSKGELLILKYLEHGRYVRRVAKISDLVGRSGP